VLENATKFTNEQGRMAAALGKKKRLEGEIGKGGGWEWKHPLRNDDASLGEGHRV